MTRGQRAIRVVDVVVIVFVVVLVDDGHTKISKYYGRQSGYFVQRDLEP